LQDRLPTAGGLEKKMLEAKSGFFSPKRLFINE